MKSILAAAALVFASGAAFAQTVPAQTTPVPGQPAPMRNAAPGATPPAVTTPSGSVNTGAATTNANPSAVQTSNTTHRTAAAPVPGRNSFTQGQAARRIASAGYTNVSGLKKDNQGIWRGQAQKDGASVSVSLDYQGNVTAQ